MTSVTLYGIGAASGTLATAGKFATGTGGTGSTQNTKINNSTGWGELYALGNAGSWSGAGSEPAPSGNGWLWDVTTLEGQTLTATTLTFKLAVTGSSGVFCTAVFHFRLYKRSSGGVYTQIIDAASASTDIHNTTTNNVTASGTATQTAFSTGDKLYLDMPTNLTANSSSIGVTLNVAEPTSGTTGVAGDVEIDGIVYSAATSHLLICDGFGGVFS